MTEENKTDETQTNEETAGNTVVSQQPAATVTDMPTNDVESNAEPSDISVASTKNDEIDAAVPHIATNNDEHSETDSKTDSAENEQTDGKSENANEHDNADNDDVADAKQNDCTADDGEWVKPDVPDKPQHMKQKDRTLSFAIPIALVIAIVAVLLVRVYVVEPYVIPSESMDPTIEIGDMILGEKISLKSHAPKQGDIIFFKNPAADSPHGVLVKRVVAVGGQTVDLRNGKVYIDGVEEKNEHAHGMSMPLAEEYLETDVTFPYKVPKGYIWVMGDNRENSLDSRSFGAIPIDSVYAESWLRYWPFNRIGEVD